MDQKTHVLIVDDERLYINMLGDILSQNNYVVSVALNGEQALKAVMRQPQPALILLDVNMPGIDGYEVCQRLKANPKTTEIPIIFITSLSDDADEEKGMQLGAIDYITKPYSPAIVVARIGNHLRLKRQLDTLDKLATKDAVTGIGNQRRLVSYLDIEWQQATRQSTPISLILLDIDHFENFTDDYYNSTEKDDCLRLIATTLTAERVGHIDLVARDEEGRFVVVLPNRDQASALQIAEKLRQAVVDLQISYAHSAAVPVATISLGVASLVATAHHTPASLISDAAENLDQAKAAGGNQVVGHQTPGIEKTTVAQKTPILLVDDERLQINMLGNILGNHYSLSVALEGEQALARAAMTPQPELILLDIQMPGSNGYEICRRLKNNPVTQAIPIIFMSAMSGQEDEAKGLALGAVDYLTKPLSAPLVLARVNLQLELKQAWAHLSAGEEENITQAIRFD